MAGREIDKEKAKAFGEGFNRSTGTPSLTAAGKRFKAFLGIGEKEKEKAKDTG